MTGEIMVIHDVPGGDGCCGGLVNDEFLGLSGAAETACDHHDTTGRIYRYLRDIYAEDLDINMVAPTNTIAILCYFIRYWLKREISAIQLVRQLTLGVRISAWFYNGRWLNRDGSAAEQDILDRVAREQTNSRRPTRS